MSKADRVVTPEGKQEVPPMLRLAFYALLLTAGVVSVPAIGAFGPLPTTAMLDIWVVTFVSFALVRGRTAHVGLLIFLACYSITRVVPAYLGDDPLPDFARAYRWLLYLAAFLFAIGRNWGPVRTLRWTAVALIALALLKATLSYVFIGPEDRPGLLLENNFEIALFSGLYVVLYKHMSAPQRLVGLIMLAGLMILAGSRSGAVAFALVPVYVLWQSSLSRATRSLATVYALPIVAVVPIAVFADRTESLATIDRLNFLDVFTGETRAWGLSQWMLGTEPISPLSPSSCERLAFYEPLLSADGSCYAVIFHAFVLRVVFDAGMAGLVLAFLLPWMAMRRAGVSKPMAIALLGIAATNSLSVSGLNNPYVALPILLSILLAGNEVAGRCELERATQPVSSLRPKKQEVGRGAC